MIQYSLKCANGHRFDSWFGSAADYDKVHAAGMVTCAICGSTDVTKELMAPAVAPARKAEDRPLSGPASPAEQMVAELRTRVESSSEYVGDAFAAQARAMHEGEMDAKSIYGEAKLDDAKALVEDGVPVVPLPFRPSAKDN